MRVDTVLENNWAYENFEGTGLLQTNLSYSATLTVGEESFSVDELTHYLQARWHRRLWSHGEPAVYAKLDTDYIQRSKARVRQSPTRKSE